MPRDALRERRRHGAAVPVAGIVATLLVAGLIALPFAALALRIAPARLAERLLDPAVLEALRLSLVTTAAATLVTAVVGLPVAYMLAMRRFSGQRWVELLLQLPMVLPPTVAGVALLLAFGRTGLAGRSLDAFGIALPFTTAGVVLAQVFMSLPFFIGPARAGFAAVDPRLVEVAATLRASGWRTFTHVMLPLAAPSIVTGVAMSGARALGEFGATITFAGNLPGVTQTMPLAVYVALQSDLEAAIVMSVLLVIMAVGLLAGLQWGAGGGLWGQGDARDRRPAPPR